MEKVADNGINVIEMQGICKAFNGVAALENVDFTLRRGEVHAVAGENGAGKSTLVKILLGIYQRDRGTVKYKGEEVFFKTPQDGLQNGISMIHQEINLIMEMTVAENIFLGREDEFVKFGFLQVKKRNEAAGKIIKHTGKELNIDPGIKVKYLTVAQMQMVELVRAVANNPSVIIMDEPTSALSRREIEILYGVVDDLAGRGVSIIFISHKLDEIFRVCKRITILRDGCLIGNYDCADLDEEQVIKMIAGRNLQAGSREKREPGEKVLSVRSISGQKFSDIGFSVCRGEILGFYGLVGAGRSEIMRAIFGVDKPESGTIFIEGKKARIRRPRDAVRLGIGMVTEDRLRMGCLYNFSVMQNVTLAAFYMLCKPFQFYRPVREMKKFAEIAQQLSVKYGSPRSNMGELSGGNQQKSIIARWLLTAPKILILDEPTRGIDVGSKAEIYKLIKDLAKTGVAILLVSSELPEIMTLSDRIMVVHNGKIRREYDAEGISQETLVKNAFGLD